jgi:holo-[acyl-carrier protein] synthase
MIIGMGNDLCDIRRIEKSLARFGDRFKDRVFTDIEKAKADRRVDPAGTYAKRFAAKEATAKALGTGINFGVSWREIGVVNLPGGKPTVVLTGRAAEKLAELTPEGYRAQVDITLTDEYPLAQAFVLISAVKL